MPERALDPKRPLLAPLLACVAWIAEGRCWIEDRDSGEMRPLVPNTVQRKIIARMIARADRGEMIRGIIPKARKMGVSTVIQAVLTFLCSYLTGRKALTYAQTTADTKTIFRLARLIYEHMTGKKPGSESMIRFADMGSLYECRTVGGRGVSRGDNPHSFHVSELASCQSQGGLDAAGLAGLENATPKQPHTIGIIESTGEGQGGEFYTKCMDALKGIGDYELWFFPWFDDDRYRLPVPEDLKLSDAERKMKSLHKLDDAQVLWYRKAFQAACGDGKNLSRVARFKNEFPTILDDCFAMPKGRVFPHFDRQEHVRHIDVTSGQWDLYRGVDWGASYEHPQVVAWIAHDKAAPPAFTIEPGEGCEEAVREFMAYRRNEKTGDPVKADDHSVDCVRMVVSTETLTGHVHLYRLYYDRSPPASAEIARRIHEMSGWKLPEGVDLLHLEQYEPGRHGEQYKATVADRSRPGSILDFSTWGVEMIGHTAPAGKPTKKGEVEDGILILDALMCGEAWIDIPQVDKHAELVQSAHRALEGSIGRPLTLTDDERDALDEERRRFEESQHPEDGFTGGPLY